MSRHLFGVGAVLLSVLMLTPINGQTNAERFIRGLDANGSGYIAPDEIPEKSRALLEKYARAGRLDLRKSNSIRRWDQAIHRYNERRRSGNRRISVEKTSGILEFGPDPEAPLVPGFGLPQVKYPYTQDDLEQAEKTLRRYDRNDDGYLDRAEARRTRWTRTDPFENDFNEDDRLNALELAQRYAARRMLEDGRYRRYRASRTNGYDNDRSDRSNNRSRGSGDRNTRNLIESLMRRYDTNRSRSLELSELDGVGMKLREADDDQNEVLSREELGRWISREIEERANDLSDVLPNWFFERDTDGDGQIQMVEFDTEWENEKLREFAGLDLNDDGIVTSDELLQSSAIVGGTFANLKGEILTARTTVVSEIDVADDYMIGDLNVQLSITHTAVGQLDGYLIGPDGQRIELFTAVGRSGDHFDNTVFDDEANRNITKSRAPFQGSYRPEAVNKKDQPRLGRYKNKNLKGLWQLMIRASRSDRPGMLHSWSLIVKPADESAE